MAINFGRKKRAISLGVSEIDYNARFTSPTGRLAAAQSALRATNLGRGGVVRVDLVGDEVKFTVSSTKQTFNTLQEALDQATRSGVNELVPFSPFGKKSNQQIARAQAFLNKFGVPDTIFRDMGTKVRGLSLDKKNRLRAAGIDVDDLSRNLNIDLMFLGAEEGDGGSVASRLMDMRSNGLMNGITILDDKGARVIQARHGDKVLDTYQTHLLFSMTGHDFYDKEKISKILDIDYSDPRKFEEAMDALSGSFEKTSKRVRRLLSSRDISLGGKELEDLIANFSHGAVKSLEDVTLIHDPTYSILSRFADKNFNFKYSVNSKGLSKLASRYDPDAIMEQLLDSYETKLDPKGLDELKAAILSFNKDKTNFVNGDWYSDRLKKHLLSGFAGSSTDRGIVVNSLFDSLEKADDGIAQGNNAFLQRNIAMLRNQRRGIANNLSKLSGTDKEKAIQALSQIDGQIEKLEGAELSQITAGGRLRIAQLGKTATGESRYRNIKTAVDFAQDFTDDLKDYALIISKNGLKGDTQIAGDVTSLVLSGFGVPKETVYADPILTAFHPDVFATPETLEASLKNAKRVTMEYKMALDTGVIPEKIRKMIMRQANMDVDMVPATSRSSAVRNRRLMQELKDMIESGISPNESPVMANLLHKFFATQAFKEDMNKGIISPVIPDLYRFPLTTELGMANVGKGQWSTAKKAFEGVRDSSGNVIAKGVELPVMRIEGHKAILPISGPGQYYASLGGFDLDDKGLPRIVTYMDEQNNGRIASYMFRQPTGNEEVFLAKLRMDQETIRSLWGTNDFSTALDDVIEQATRNKEDIGTLNILRKYIDIEDGNEYLANKADDIEGAVARVLKRQAEMGLRVETGISERGLQQLAKTGSGSLKLNDLFEMQNGKMVSIDPKFTRQGVHKIMLENDVFDLTSDIKDAVDSTPNLNPALKSELRAAATREDAMRIIDKYIKSGNDAEALSVLYKAIENASLRSVSENSSLGSYINRSTAIGHTFNQFEDFIDTVLSSGPNGKRLADTMVNKYMVGLLPQELAIDSSVTVARGKRFNQATLQILESQRSVVDAGKAGGVLGSMLDIRKTMPDGTQVVATSLDDIGKSQLEILGRRIGFARGLDLSSFSDDMQDALRLGFDPEIIRTRIKSDSKMIIQSLITGMKEAQEASNSGLGFAVSSDIEDQIKAMNLILTKTDDEAISFLKENFGLKEGSRYLSLAKQQTIGSLIKEMVSTPHKAHISSLNKAPHLLAAESTLEESRMASYITEKHRNQLELLRQYASQLIDSESDVEKAFFTTNIEGISEAIYGDIDSALKANNVGMQGLFNSLNRQFSDVGVDINSLRYSIGDLGEMQNPRIAELHSMMMTAQRASRMEYYKQFDTTLAEELRGQIRNTVADTRGKTLTELARMTLEAMDEDSSLMDDENKILRDVLSRAAGFNVDPDPALNEAQARAVRRELDMQHKILEGLMYEETLTDDELNVLNTIGVRGTATVADDSIGFSDDMARAIVESVSPIQSPLNRGVYKRFSQKIQEDAFRETISSANAKKVGIGLAALVVGSFAYQHNKGRSNDDIKGPPLLPGGSAYETDYPNRLPEIEYSSGKTYNPGVTYNVNIYGSQDQIRKFNAGVGGVSNGNISTTMYNRIPDAGRDPYGSIASSF